MLRTNLVHFLAVTLIVIAANTLVATAGDSTNVDWLRGSGNDLELCLQAEVLDADGQPATGLALSASMAAKVAMPLVKPEIDGHRFKIWTKVNQPYPYTAVLQAASAKSGHIACR